MTANHITFSPTTFLRGFFVMSPNNNFNRGNELDYYTHVHKQYNSTSTIGKISKPEVNRMDGIGLSTIALANNEDVDFFQNFVHSIIRDSKPMEMEFIKIVEENFWDLF